MAVEIKYPLKVEYLRERAGMKQAIKHLKLRLEIATFFFRHPGPCTTSAALGPPSQLQN